VRTARAQKTWQRYRLLTGCTILLEADRIGRRLPFFERGADEPNEHEQSAADDEPVWEFHVRFPNSRFQLKASYPSFGAGPFILLAAAFGPGFRKYTPTLSPLTQASSQRRYARPVDDKSKKNSLN
jgi:hypothetical protein